jgi:DNA mismatch repair protein MutL
MIDQHAAHERIVFERLKKAILEKRVQAQPFLIPKRMDLSAREAKAVEENVEFLAEIGLDIEHFGGNTYLVRAVPTVLVNSDIDEFVTELLAFLEEKVGKLKKYEAMEEMMAVMACHGAIRAGKPLSEREMVSLIDELHKTELSTNCPHGRPISKMITWYEMERMFKRVV